MASRTGLCTRPSVPGRVARVPMLDYASQSSRSCTHLSESRPGEIKVPCGFDATPTSSTSQPVQDFMKATPERGSSSSSALFLEASKKMAFEDWLVKACLEATSAAAAAHSQATRKLADVASLITPEDLEAVLLNACLEGSHQWSSPMRAGHRQSLQWGPLQASSAGPAEWSRKKLLLPPESKDSALVSEQGSGLRPVVSAANFPCSSSSSTAAPATALPFSVASLRGVGGTPPSSTAGSSASTDSSAAFGLHSNSSAESTADACSSQQHASASTDSSAGVRDLAAAVKLTPLSREQGALVCPKENLSGAETSQPSAPAAAQRLEGRDAISGAQEDGHVCGPALGPACCRQSSVPPLAPLLQHQEGREAESVAGRCLEDVHSQPFLGHSLPGAPNLHQSQLEEAMRVPPCEDMLAAPAQKRGNVSQAGPAPKCCDELTEAGGVVAATLGALSYPWLVAASAMSSMLDTVQCALTLFEDEEWGSGGSPPLSVESTRSWSSSDDESDGPVSRVVGATSVLPPGQPMRFGVVQGKAHHKGAADRDPCCGAATEACEDKGKHVCKGIVASERTGAGVRKGSSEAGSWEDVLQKRKASKSLNKFLDKSRRALQANRMFLPQEGSQAPPGVRPLWERRAVRKPASMVLSYRKAPASLDPIWMRRAFRPPTPLITPRRRAILNLQPATVKASC